jgi:hypothetical protein
MAGLYIKRARRAACFAERSTHPATTYLARILFLYPVRTTFSAVTSFMYLHPVPPHTARFGRLAARASCSDRRSPSPSSASGATCRRARAGSSGTAAPKTPSAYRSIPRAVRLLVQYDEGLIDELTEDVGDVERA